MKGDYLRVIGIDPGLETTGVAVLDVKTSSYIPVFCGCIITDKALMLHKRLAQIYSSIVTYIQKYTPDCLAIEEIFFSTNVKTALMVGQARGVAMLAGTNNDLEVYEYTPLQVKQSIVGYGRATKNQIKYMLKMILGVNDDFFPSRDDAWDAMGIAVCHASMQKYESKVNSYIK
jgi:crossover junction endodeoxyribonuclease RuvC